MAVNTNRFLPSSRGGASAITRPTATLVPYKKPAGGALVKQPTPDDEGDTKPSLEEDVAEIRAKTKKIEKIICLLYTSPSPRDATLSRMPSSA